MAFMQETDLSIEEQLPLNQFRDEKARPRKLLQFTTNNQFTFSNPKPVAVFEVTI